MTAILLLAMILWMALFGEAAFMLQRSHRRIYRYAVMMADRFDVDDPRSQAYSDMATVIALDGKASPKAWAGRGGSMSSSGEGSNDGR